MPHAPLTEQDAQRINALLEESKAIRETLVRGKLAGIVTDAEIKAHDDATDKLRAIKRQFIDLPR